MCSHSGLRVRFSFALIANSLNVHRPNIPKKGGGGGGWAAKMCLCAHLSGFQVTET